MCKKEDTREKKERKPRNVQPKRREVVMHRSRLNAWVRTRSADEQLFAALYSQGTTSACLGKGGSGHCTNWEHAMRCRTWITWSSLTLGRPSRPPPTLTLCANFAHGRMSRTRTSRRTHRLHLPRLVKPNKSWFPCLCVLGFVFLARRSRKVRGYFRPSEGVAADILPHPVSKSR